MLQNRVLFFILLGCTISGLLNAKDAPDWVSKKPKNDSNYKYYIGRASNASSEGQGFSDAYKDAVEQANGENYGVKAKIDTQTYSTSGKVELTKRASETSRKVQFNSFELVDTYSDKNKSDKYNVWIQYKYPVSEIEKEKARLSSLASKKETIIFQDAGNTSAGVASQPFEIVTEPAGASVYLDDKLLLVNTPLKINIDEGSHTIQIDHPNCETRTEKLLVQVQNSKPRRLEYPLKPAYSVINVESEPSEAMVFIDGEPKGKTPLSNISVRARRDIVIQIQHPETETFSQTIKLEKDEIRKINAKLSLKPAKLNISTDPVTGVAVSINGVEKGSTPLKTLILEPGTYSISFSKENYESEIQSVTLTGNEQKTLEIVKLNKKSSASIDSSLAEAEDVTKKIDPNIESAKSYRLRGIEKYKLKDYAGAIKDFDKAIELNPKDANAYYIRGWSNSDLKDYAGAIKDYDKAIELDPKNAYNYIGRAQSKIKLRDRADYKTKQDWNKGLSKYKLQDYEEAIKDYDKVIELKPEAYHYYMRGEAKSLLQDYAGAIKDYDKAIELEPKKGDYLLRGKTKGFLQDYAGAIKDYDKAIELNPKDANAYYARGRQKYGLEDYKGVINDCSKAIELDPKVAMGPVWVAKNFETLEERQHTRPTDSCDYMLKRSKLALKKDYKGFIKDYIEVGDWYATGVVESCNKAIKLDPKDADAYYLRGQNKYKLLKDYEGAIKDFNKVIELDPKYAKTFRGENVYHQLGESKFNLKDYAGAIKIYDKAIEQNPKDESAYFKRGGSKLLLGDSDGWANDRSISDIIKYDKAIELNPKDARAYSNRGQAKGALKDYEGAIKDCNTAIELNPENGWAYFNRGWVKSKIKDYTGAIKDYDKAIELNPKDASGYGLRGSAKYDLKDYQGAIKDYTKAGDLGDRYAQQMVLVIKKEMQK